MLARVPRISPTVYARITLFALATLFLIVLTGAAVRVTGSGLGCPTWPKCDGELVRFGQLGIHGAIEEGNRFITGLVAVAAIAASLAAFLRRPFRRDLAIIGVLLPLGVILQAVLGGVSVLAGLAPGWVMAHFGTSMLILLAAFSLHWRARHEPGERPRVADRWAVVPVRALTAWGAFVLFAGTAATGAGPHAGASGTGELVPRLDFWGGGTMTALIHRHGEFAAALGVAAVIVWFLLRRRGANPLVRRAMTVVCLLLAAQGAVGLTQYQLGLPAGLVWIHVLLAATTWVALVWATAAAGTLAPQPQVATERERGVSVTSAGV